jgi:aspartate dehydrogenase
LITSPSQLAALAPDVILEAASRAAVREWGETALRTARRFVVSSTSAFADDEFLRELRLVARQTGNQLVLSPGALAGVDALSAAARLDLREVRHRIVKPPRSWALGSAPSAVTPSETVVLFNGSAREAAERYPLNANVTVVSALSGIGLDRTVVELVSDPLAHNNRHELHAEGDFGVLSITLENRPLQSNPKSSELAALALVRLAENEVSEFVL